MSDKLVHISKGVVQVLSTALYIFVEIFLFFGSLCSTDGVHKECAARVRACNSVKFEAGQNLLPVLK